MGNDDRIGELAERIARLEAQVEQVPSNSELISTAGAAGKLGAREHLEGLDESFQKDTHRRLESLEKLKTYVVFIAAALFGLGIILGQKLPAFVP